MILDGRAISERILSRAKNLISKLSHRPKVAIILATKNPAQIIYVETKMKRAIQIGMDVSIDEIHDEEKIIRRLQDYKNDDSVCGVIVQLPLPEHMNTERIIMNTDPQKDVDGLHPLNQGRIIWSRSIEELMKKDFFIPPTSLAVMEFISNYKIEVNGKDAVLLNFSPLIGKPLSAILFYMGADVTIVNINSPGWRDKTLRADILVTAIGIPGIIKKDCVNKDAIVFDAGIAKTDRIRGDCDLELLNYVKAITPVPGGVGAVTTAFILENVCKACYKLHR